MQLFSVQHPDTNIGPAFFNGLEKDQLLITKIFYTVQGEGPFAGMPAVFVRLAGCNRGDKLNMGCQFCDTQFQVHKGRVLSYADIEREMLDGFRIGTMDYGLNRDKPLVVITGGEPMMQDNLVGFIEFLGRGGWEDIQIESNGDRLALGFKESKWCATVELVVSPKITRNGYRSLSQPIMERANALKFLIDHRSASPYFDVPEYASKMDPNQVFLSPITVYHGPVHKAAPSAWDASMVDHQSTSFNFRRAAELALIKGFRLSMQQHLWFVVE